MRPVEGFPAGDYMVLPITREATGGKWQAGLTLSGNPRPGEPHLREWLFEQNFRSQAEALSYATSQGELWASDPEAYLEPKLGR